MEKQKNLINENYQPQDALYNLKHFDGDVIIQNRYGATLRFGSSLSENALNQRTNQNGDSIILGPTVPLNNDPIIVMRVGQQESPTITRSTDYGLVVEDINNDLSSFVLSTNQLIEFKLDGFRSSDGDSYIKLGKTHITRNTGLTGLSGNQSLLTSGRIVVNAKTNNIILSAKQDLISLVSGDTVLDAGNDFVIGIVPFRSKCNLTFQYPKFGIVTIAFLPTLNNSAITFSGFDNFYYLFPYTATNDEFNIPHDLNILKEVFNISDGNYIKEIDLTVSADNLVEHKLGREPLGWIVVRKFADANIWESLTAGGVSYDRKRFINFQTDTTTTDVYFWIF